MESFSFIHFLDAHPWLTVLVFAVIQVYFFSISLKGFKQLRGFFPKGIKWDKHEDEGGNILINEPDAPNETKNLVGELNEYIKCNEGAVDFSVIKEKTDRTLDNIYEYAASKVSFPTYLGLMGTFLGVFIGLYCFKDGLIGDSEVTNEMVNDLVQGVIVSMVTSLIGLALMVYANYRGSKSLKAAEEEKANFFDFLQLRVLPNLSTDVSSSLNRLRSTINKFEPSFRGVINEFKEAFQDCTNMFRGSFTENVTVLTTAVDKMGSNMALINDNIEKQDKLLNTLRQHEMVDTLDKFVTAANSFDSVTTTIERLEEAKERVLNSTKSLVDTQESYNKSLEIPSELLAKINAVLNRVTTFEDSINVLGKDIAKTQLFGNTQINLIEEQLRAIKSKSDLAARYQEVEDEKLEEIYKTQADAIDELTKQYKDAMLRHQESITDTMAEFHNVYNKVIGECRAGIDQKVEEFVNALNKTLDVADANKKLETLSNLNRLASMEQNIGSISTAVAETAKLNDKIGAINNTLTKVDNSIGDLGKRLASRSHSSESRSEESNEHSKKRRRGIWPFRK